MAGGAAAWAHVMRGGGRDVTRRNYRAQARQLRNEMYGELTPFERMMVRN